MVINQLKKICSFFLFFIPTYSWVGTLFAYLWGLFLGSANKSHSSYLFFGAALLCSIIITFLLMKCEKLKIIFTINLIVGLVGFLSASYVVNNYLTQPSCDMPEDQFLIPYIDELIKETPKENLDRIRGLPESELIVLHMDYGMWIRNKWLHGNRNPKLVNYYLCKGYYHPDDMSQRIIINIWQHLNKTATVEEKVKAEKLRERIIEKRATYDKLMNECESQLKKYESRFKECLVFDQKQNKMGPFFKIFVNNTGKIEDTNFFTTQADASKKCVGKILSKFKFSAFGADKKIDLYITSYPKCRTSALDSLTY